MALVKMHKFRFGVNGDFLRSSMWKRRTREHRSFPKGFADTWEYVNEYFRLNSYFKESSWQ